MERIGIAASKMAKGNLFLYNFYVFFISFLFSIFIFLIAGLTVVFALIIIAYIDSEIVAFGFQKDWYSILLMCMVSLTIIIGLFNIFAVWKNIKFPKTKE